MTDDRATLETISEMLEQLLSNQFAMLKLMDSCVHTETLLYTAGDMAAMCHVKPETWSRWVRKAEAPQPIKVNGAPKWPAELVGKWIKRKLKER